MMSEVWRSAENSQADCSIGYLALIAMELAKGNQTWISPVPPKPICMEYISTLTHGCWGGVEVKIRLGVGLLNVQVESPRAQAELLDFSLGSGPTPITLECWV